MKKIIVRENFEGFGIQKRFDLIVDVLYTGEEFELGGKINSIIGQYGISDSDSFVDSINHAFNAILIELDEDDLVEENKYNFIFSGFNTALSLKNEAEGSLAFGEQDDDADEEDEESEQESDEESDENKVAEKNTETASTVENSTSEFDYSNQTLAGNLNVFFSQAETANVKAEDLLLLKFDENGDEITDYVVTPKDLIENEFKKISISSDEDDRDDEDNEDEENTGDEENEDGEQEITFFVRMILLLYEGEKRADLYIYNPFFKKSFVNLWKLNLLSYFSILNNYKEFFFRLKSFYNLKKYMFHINLFKKHFYNFKYLNVINLYSQIPTTSKIFENFYDFDFFMYFSFKGKKKRRRRNFKVYYLKKKKQISAFFKSFRWFSYEILFKFFILKYVYFDIKFSYNELKKKILTVYSIMVAFKKKFGRKYRRRKSFKRKVLRNKLGIKMSFIRQQFFEKKKKKK